MRAFSFACPIFQANEFNRHINKERTFVFFTASIEFPLGEFKFYFDKIIFWPQRNMDRTEQPLAVAKGLFCVVVP